MVFHQQVADLPSVLRLTQILTSCGTNIEMSANLKAIWSVKMAPLNSHVESPARTLSMSSCTRSPQLENGFCMLRSLRGAWTGKNTMSNMVCICLVSFPTPTGKLSKRFVTAGGSFEEKILGIWESIQAFYLLPTHYGPAAQKTQSWQASWYFFKVVKLQQGVALYDYQHGSKLGDFFLWWWFAPKFHVLFVRVLQLGFLISTYLLCPLLWSGPPEDLPMYDDASGDTWVAEEIPNESCLIFWVCWPSHPQVGNVPVLFPDILCKVFFNVASHKGELQVQSQWLPDACETLGEQPWLGATAFGTLAFWVQQVAQGAIGGTPTQPSHRKNQERVFWLTVLVFGMPNMLPNGPMIPCHAAQFRFCAFKHSFANQLTNISGSSRQQILWRKNHGTRSVQLSPFVIWWQLASTMDTWVFIGPEIGWIDLIDWETYIIA